MSQSRIVQFVALLACAGLVWASTLYVPKIDVGRESLTMIANESPVKNAPPEFAFAIQAFGAFRGLVTNIAFIRAEEYKRQGRYYDAMQLHKWICKLQPRFPTVWQYCAWNMAWNISVTTYTPEERWNWVYNGLKLLRDQGIVWNPRAVNLYKDLAWIYVNKMAEPVDDYHLVYKKNWAWRMHLVLGTPPDPLAALQPDKPFQPVGNSLTSGELYEAADIERERRGNRQYVRPKTLDELIGKDGPTPFQIVQKAAYDKIKTIDDAPQSLSALYAAFPDAREMVAKLSSEMGITLSDNPLDEETYWHKDGLAFTFFQRYRKLVDPRSLQQLFSKKKADDPDAANIEKFDAIVGVRAKNPTGEALVRYMQRKVLTETYKLDPKHMLVLISTFGPMDWRTVEAHSLYWVTYGIIKGKETLTSFTNDKTNTLRLLFFSLIGLTRGNHLMFEPYPDAIQRSYYNATPDPNFIEPMHQAYLTYGPMVDPDPGQDPAGETFRAGHVSFLMEAVRILYMSNREREAQYYFDYLRDHYGRRSSGELTKELDKTLRDFVFDSFTSVADTNKESKKAISSIIEAAMGELADSNLARYNSLTEFAWKLHDTYTREKQDPLSDRLKLPPFINMQADCLWNFLSFPPIDESVTIRKARLWLGLPPEIKVRVYDIVKPMLAAECDRWDYDETAAFPEPVGMKAFRETDEYKLIDRQVHEDKVETPVQTNQ